ncbi:putative proteasome activator complex subunit 3 [Apostichopus japonicus]|uniref:Putative proteasome activator complex subunit 3 n=1 Tax=Stichopus japonicus TaxID=307972 RepID=A0A2G8LMC7_STIJA|nr:putative proteasome activator complex subunit 3 [Apostichopus japonicus]
MAVSNALQEVNEIKKAIQEKGEMLVKDVFPAKVLELNKLAESDLFKVDVCRKSQSALIASESLSQLVPITLTKRVTSANVCGGAIPCNSDIQHLTNIMKPLICVLIEHCNSLKMWIQLLIPRIEDGNNFGVSIQEDTLAELRQVESDAASYLDQITRYFITRGKLISKVAKYPHVGDYRKGVEEIDQKEFFNLRLTCIELRNTYLSLLDLIEKNKDKIRKPRNSNAETLY